MTRILPDTNSICSDLSADCAQLCHRIRSPLGTALGVIGDLLEGYDLTRDDIQLAALALEEMAQMIADFESAMMERGRS